MVKRFAEYLKFNMNFAVLTASFFNEVPEYVIKSIIILCFLLVVWLFYYTYRKYKSIDNHTNKKYKNSNSYDDNSNTYAKDKKEYKKDVSELGANTLPNGQTIVTIADKIIELRKKK